MAQMTTTIIDLLRHGEPEGGEIFRGSTDVLLNETGWQQMIDATALQAGGQSPWDRIFTSPLKRCADFAQHLCAHSTAEMEEVEELQEIHFGEWEGQPITEVQQKDNKRLQQFWRDPENNPPPGGEPVMDAYHRSNEFLDKVLQNYSGKHLLLVSHGGIIRLLLVRALGLPVSAIAQISVPYACFSRLQVFQREGSSPWIQLISHHGSLKQMQAGAGS